MEKYLTAILESAEIEVSASDDVVQSFEEWLGCNDDPNYQGTTVEDSAPLKQETYQLIRDWMVHVWGPQSDAATQTNALMESAMSAQDISLAKVLPSVRATQWIVYWMDLNLLDARDNAITIDKEDRQTSLFAHLLHKGDTTIIRALYHYIQNLPVLQAQMHAYTQNLQKNTGVSSSSSSTTIGIKSNIATTTTTKTTELSNPQSWLQQYALAQSVAQRFQIEWDQHMVDLEKICGQMYLLSDTSQRKTCRRLLGQVWTQYIYSSASSTGLRQENTRAAGIRLTLQVLYRILLGVSTIQESHEQLLMQQLIPLHKPDAMVLWRDQVSVLELYHEPLVKCMAVIMQKKQSLVGQTIAELLHPDIFPIMGNTPKQVLLLHEVDTFLSLLGDNEECTMAWWTTFLTVLKRCMTSDHSRVAERALEFFKNKTFKGLIVQKYQFSLEVLLPALVRQQPSWNPTVRKMTYHVLKELQGRDERVFEQMSNRLFAGAVDKGPSGNATDPAKVTAPASQILQTGPAQSVVSDTSLKAGMGTWRPPTRASNMSSPAARVPGDTPGRRRAPWASGGGSQPPLAVTGVAPWATSAGSGSNPPLAVTGVAPWAVKPSPSQDGPPFQQKRPAPGSTASDSAAEEAGKEPPLVSIAGINYVEQYMAALKPPDEETGASSWSKAQMAETPTLLPDLKFHDLVFGHDLGSGAFGNVRYARLIDKTKTRSHWPEYAVKVISTDKIRELGYETSVQREVAVLRILSHPGIARLVSSFRFQDGAYLVLEYASHGDLHTLLRKHGSLDNQSTRFVVGSVVAALASIHDIGMVYADLKTENVLITETGHIKITDFGGCRPVTPEAKAMVRSIAKGLLNKLRDGDWKVKKSDAPGRNMVEEFNIDDDETEEDDRVEGTTSYLPPEVVMGSVPSKQADSWALGCFMYQCLTGRPPFFEVDDETTRQTIVSFNVYQEEANAADPLFADKHATSVEPTARALIKACLRRERLQRPLMDELSRFEFFAEAAVDVFSLHSRPAYPLDVGDVAPAPNAQWARRQFSSIWAPQPVAYDISLPDDTLKLSSVQRPNNTEAIVEGDEANGYFSASGQAPKALGKISELLPPTES